MLDTSIFFPPRKDMNNVNCCSDMTEILLKFYALENTIQSIKQHFLLIPQCSCADPHSSVSSVADLRTGDRWFDPWLGQYSLRGFMIVIVTGFIPLSPLSVVTTMVMWESSQWLGKNIVQSTG